MPDSVRVGDAQVLLRVWVEQHDPSSRGRLVLPPSTGQSTARGVDDLCELVRRALEQLEDDLTWPGTAGTRPPPRRDDDATTTPRARCCQRRSDKGGAA